MSATKICRHNFFLNKKKCKFLVKKRCGVEMVTMSATKICRHNFFLNRKKNCEQIDFILICKINNTISK